MAPSPTTSRPKICHVIHLDGAGGGPVVVVDHLRTFRDEFELSAIHGGSGSIAATCETFGLPHWELPISRIRDLPAGIPAMVSRFRQLQPDLVVLHGQWAGPAGALAARIAGIQRMIYVCHWPAFYTDWDLLRVLRNRFAETLPCRWADRIVTLSRGNAYQFLIRHLVEPGKLRLIHNSMDLARLPPPGRAAEVRARHGWSDAHVNVVSVGRLSDQKRVDWLLRSWALVAPSAPQARLWIVGEGPDRADLECLAGALGITDTCTFLGPQPQGIDYIAAADLVAMSTVYEGFSLVPVEVMACGKSLVANGVDGVNGTFTDGVEGFLVPPSDFGQFAERLLRLISDPALRSEMGQRGQERVREYSPEVMMGKYRDLFQEVLALPPGPANRWLF